MKEKDWDYIAQVERAIKNKYGEDAVTNPASTWNEEKSEDYAKQRQQFDKKILKRDDAEEKVADQGFLISKKLIKNEHKGCCVCKKDIFKVEDDITMIKYNSCYNCFIQYIDGREERWLEGWRPKI